MPAATPPCIRLLIEPIVRAALLEDLGRAGDITTDAVVPAGRAHRGALMAPASPASWPGSTSALLAFGCSTRPSSDVERSPDGSRARAPGRPIARDQRPGAAGMLTAERTALNFARATCPASRRRRARWSTRSRGHKAQDRLHPQDHARPAHPRRKYAVRLGGGANHRFGLDDAVLIKDNHVAIAGGVRPGVGARRAPMSAIWSRSSSRSIRWTSSPRRCDYGVDAVLLDNMGPDMLRQAVAMVDGRAITEASGRITRETAPAIAAAGVDLISSGWLTHSAPILDLGLDIA